MNTVSIIGCGWLGLPWAKKLVELGYQVNGTTTSVDKIASLEQLGIIGYLLKEENGKWDEHVLLQLIQSDRMYIFVPPGTRKSTPSFHDQLIAQLIQLIASNKLSPKIIYTSTTSVYPENTGICDENTVIEESNSGNKVVYRAERAIVQSTLDYTILRLGGLTGGNRLLAKYFSGKMDLSNGDVPINMAHLEDVLGVLEWLLAQVDSRQVYNVCSPMHPTKKEFYTKLCMRFGMELPHYNEEVSSERNKQIDVSKLLKKGYVFKFSDPNEYTYND